MSDSYVAKQACLVNLQQNNIPTESVKFYDSVTQVDSSVDLVLLKIPKTTALLEQQLIDLQTSSRMLKMLIFYLDDDTQILIDRNSMNIRSTNISLSFSM